MNIPLPRRGAVGAAVLAALALAACQDRGSDRAMARFGTESRNFAAAADAPAEPAPTAPAAAEPAQPTAPGETQSAARPQPDAPIPEVDARPERLMGLDPQALDAALGRPELVRREKPAEVWQYRAGSCVLDVFLYPAGQGREVLHLEARDAASAAPADAKSCLTALLRRQQAAAAEG